MAAKSSVNLHPEVIASIQSLVPYVPGKPIEETQREFGLKKVVKLASNENPLGPSPRALRAIRGKAVRDLHRYPDASGYHLKQALSRKLGVPANWLTLGNGSNEVIDTLIRVFTSPGDAIVTSQAAFVAYKVCASAHGVRTLEAPLTSDLRFDLPALLECLRQDTRAKIVFLPNPNNPTGTHFTREEFDRFLAGVRQIRDGKILVVLDVAYVEYQTAKDLPDPMKALRENPQVVVLRTFSKAYGLAGLRIGYGIAHPEVIGFLERVREPFNLNALALLAAEAALADARFVAKAIQVNRQGLQFWKKTLDFLAIPFWPTQGNFILIDTETGMGRSGVEVFQACLRRGVIFRPVANYGLKGALRISVGTPAENEFAARALAAENGMTLPRKKAARRQR